MAVMIRKTRQERRGGVGRLGAYLAAGAGAGLVGSSAEAGVVTIDIAALGLTGTNGGVTAGSFRNVSNFTPGDTLFIANGYGSLVVRGLSLQSVSGTGIAVTGAGSSKPKAFADNTLISASNTFVSSYMETAFRSNVATSPDFGPNTFLGFKDSQNRYGYIEVTWTATTNTFQILSAAYESVANTPITTPNRSAAVPEPSTLGLMALGAAGLLAARARQRPAQAAAEPVAH